MAVRGRRPAVAVRAGSVRGFEREGGDAALVDEDEFAQDRDRVGGRGGSGAGLQNVRAPAGHSWRARSFLNVTPWRSKKRQSAETEKRSPPFWIRRGGLEQRDVPGVRRIKPSKSCALRLDTAGPAMAP